MTLGLTLSLCVSSPFSQHLPLIILVHTVINPCIRFSWIEREWDRDYIDGAKKIVLEVVCSFDAFFPTINIFT